MSEEKKNLEEIVENIDAMAEEMGLTRSGLIAVATRDYIHRMRR